MRHTSAEPLPSDPPGAQPSAPGTLEEENLFLKGRLGALTEAVSRNE